MGATPEPEYTLPANRLLTLAPPPGPSLVSGNHFDSGSGEVNLLNLSAHGWQIWLTSKQTRVLGTCSVGKDGVETRIRPDSITFLTLILFMLIYLLTPRHLLHNLKLVPRSKHTVSTYLPTLPREE